MTKLIDWLLIAIYTILFGKENAMFFCSCHKRANWTAINLAAKRKCVAAARLLQKEMGGKLVYMVAKDWPKGMICDHFMNEINGKIVDRYGNTAVEVAPGYYDFGHGLYYLVAIVDQYDDFSIDGFKTLFRKDTEIHNMINA